jgi:hypothetical protein
MQGFTGDGDLTSVLRHCALSVVHRSQDADARNFIHQV